MPAVNSSQPMISITSFLFNLRRDDMEVELNLNIDTADVSSRFLNSIWAHNEIYHDCSTVCLTLLLSLIVPYASLFSNRQTMHKVIYIRKEILINNKWTMTYEIQLN